MVELVQTEIEMEGFVQLVTGMTRQWRNPADSMLDHCWTNCEGRVLKCFNIVRGASDHNVVGLDISLVDIKIGGTETQGGDLGNISVRRGCLGQVQDWTDWNDILKESNVNVAASRLEEEIRMILEAEAPMKTVQERTRYSKWLKDSTKQEMDKRDTARQTAKNTDDVQDWSTYRQLRNSCTRLQRQDRSEHLRKHLQQIRSRKRQCQDLLYHQKSTGVEEGWTPYQLPSGWKDIQEASRVGRDTGPVLQ